MNFKIVFVEEDQFDKFLFTMPYGVYPNIVIKVLKDGTYYIVKSRSDCWPHIVKGKTYTESQLDVRLKFICQKHFTELL